MKIHNNVFVVTGAGNGMGREVSLELLRRGGSVVGADLNSDGLDETATLAGAHADRFHRFVCDITNTEQVAALRTHVHDRCGHVDGLVHVAGIIQPFNKVQDLPRTKVEAVVNVNLWGTYNMTEAFLPDLLRRPEACIVNVASMGAYVPVPGQAVYGATKAAVSALTMSLFAELRNTGVAVSVVYPGGVSTNITGNSGVEINVEGFTPEKAAEQAFTTPAEAGEQIVRHAIEKGKIRVKVGIDAKVMDIATRLSPKLATLILAKQMDKLLG